ncbi:class I SAM-dependent methyltransferase [Candidatus Pelagibacter bacterium]|nr:class I SAM-dependent methyltransferase [Candidatus Pelagibacter bacterium]
MSRLLYLTKTKPNRKIIYSYLKNLFVVFFLKKKRKEFINNYRRLIERKKITFDFFSQNTYDWYNCLFYLKKKKFTYLEIGSFEGNSAFFIFKFFSPKIVYCCDAWLPLPKRDGSDEGYKNFEMRSVEKNFDFNLKTYKKKLRKFKCKSRVFFKNNNKNFDLIYIDGSHFAKDVAQDCKSAWLVLNKNGVIIFDDYFWKSYDKIESNPAYAINSFLKEINGQYKVLLLSKFQLFIKKL